MELVHYGFGRPLLAEDARGTAVLAEMVNYELGVAAIVAAAAVTLPSIAFACLLTLWYGRRLRPSIGATLGIALGAALPWSLWLALLILMADRAEQPLIFVPLLVAYLIAGLAGSVPAAMLTRRAAVMPRGRRAEDR